MKKYSKILIALLALISIDQLTKYIIRSSEIFHICNYGVAWGIIIPKNILIILLIITIFFLSYLFFRYYKLIKNWKIEIEKIQKTTLLTIIVILSGALSNIIDRLYFGCVIDFIDLKFWPIFNLADIYITIGMLILIKMFYFNKQKSPKN